MNSNVPNAICSSYIEARRMNASAANGTFVLNSDAHTANRLYIKNLAYDASTKSEFAASLIGKTICYELAEPIPFHVDPQQINSLAGANNMWTDANGDLTVEYRKDGNVSDAEALSMLLGGRYTPATGPEDVSDSEALRIITGR